MALSDLLVNDEKFQAELSALVDRGHIAGDEIVDRIKAAAAETVDRLVAQESNVIHGVLTSIAATESKTVADLNALLKIVIDESQKWREQSQMWQEIFSRINLSGGQK